MKRLEVWRGRSRLDLFLVLQSDRFGHLRTRFIVPLTPDANQIIDPALSPTITVGTVSHYALTHLAFAADMNTLGNRICSVEEAHDWVRDALDLLTLGF